MATSVSRQKLRFFVNRLVTASRSNTTTTGDNRFGRPGVPSFSCSQLGGRRTSFANGQPRRPNFYSKTREGTENFPDLEDNFHFSGVGEIETITGYKFGTRHHIRSEGTDIPEHYAGRGPPEGSSAHLDLRFFYRDVTTPIQLQKEGAVANLDTLPEPSSSPILPQDCSRPGLGSELRLFSEDSRERITPSCVSDLLRTCSRAVTLCHKSSTYSSLTNYQSKRTKLTAINSSIVVNPNCLTFLVHAHRYGDSFPLLIGGQRHLYSSEGQRILSGSEQDGDDSDREKGALVHRGKEVGDKPWIQRVIPETLWPFAQLARLDKPIGTWLLAWPCFWSICLAAPSGAFPDLEILGWFGLGAILLRGAGCTVNDLLDSDIDGKVERTRQRPIASGALTPFQGLSFLGCQLLLGLGVLLQLNDFSRILGASSLLLVGTYPLMKRWTFWPQAYLGLTFNWGALLGWAAVHGNLNLEAVLPLYASGVCWTLVYDTIYAHQDKEDDRMVGVKSTALLFGNKTQIWLTGFSAGCVSGLTLAGLNCNLGWPFYVGMAAAAGQLAWQVSSVDMHNRADCNSKFVSNKWFGAIVCSAIVFGKLAALPA